MKKILLITILFIGLLYSCSKDESIKNESAKNINYTALSKSVDNQISTFQKLTPSNIEDQYLKYFKIKPKSPSTNKNIPKETTIKIVLAPHYNNLESQFMLSFYQDMANCYDNKIIELLNSKRILLNAANFSLDFKNEVNFIFNTIEKTTNEIGNILNKSQTNKTGKSAGFGDCFSQKGKTIGRAIVTGVIVGGVGGAITGATVGTVSFPGLGTASGAVAGAVFGAAKGAITGGLGELTWAALDCAMERQTLEIEYMFADDFYNDFIIAYDSDQQNLYIFEDYESIPNLVLNTSEETIIKFIE